MSEVVITQKRYEELLEVEKWLSCLEAAGLDSWDGCEFAAELMEEEETEE